MAISRSSGQYLPLAALVVIGELEQDVARHIDSNVLTNISGRGLCTIVKRGGSPCHEVAAAYKGIRANGAPPQIERHQVLHSLDQYVGLIITSPRAASAIVSVIQSVPADEAQTLVALLKEIPIYAVGKVTSKPLSDHLGVTCLGEDSGSAEVLATFIADSGNLYGPMVFLCGEKRMDALPLSFHARSQRLDELVVYASHQVDGIEWLQTASAPPQWVAFFSPSGVDAALRMTSVPWSSIKKVALGTI
ncbi:hypothetical protein DYB32_010222 [Aphanomyces invadans]|uniref:Tetrapyrrole biosynthesis uroporphyrinogen III synthase domain-containing protein n=1 Tax=Aphanomyces invadans TaxID=157072 RepID=A0A3R6WED0_9STRA|nr:hypothetical protein DYB32_010222 [Aphanomyces invadans]